MSNNNENSQSLVSENQRKHYNSDMTAAQAREAFEYDRTSGVLYRRLAGGRRREAGTVDRFGYLRVALNGRAYSAHRVIWLITTGEWPKGQIDHIDRDKLNNRWENLRDVAQGENIRNGSAPYKCNKTGLRGAYMHARGGYPYAQIRVQNKTISLGNYDSLEEASGAYKMAKKLVDADEAAALELFRTCLSRQPRKRPNLPRHPAPSDAGTTPHAPA